MASNAHRSSPLESGTWSYIRADITRYAHLLELDAPWKTRETTLHELEIATLVDRGAVERTETDSRHTAEYRLTAAGVAMIEDVRDSVTALECGCTGFRTLEDGFECGGDCPDGPHAYEREEIEEVFG